ncbi:nucleoside-diphosphate kinase [Candidatus Woesearchaeota archaeon]|nr:nucleoside-diphosphate kinase [Candidatus Woesearchaeota archaeon]
MIEKTLVLLKTDAVERGLIGRIIERFENAGLKIIGLKMQWVDKKFAEKHYTEDITKRRGKHVRDWLLEYITEGPVVAIALEGPHAIEAVRKIVGPTEPRTAPAGTIRGDFALHSYDFADQKKKAIRNLIHASGDKKDAQHEVKLWFSDLELHSYETVSEKHLR